MQLPVLLPIRLYQTLLSRLQGAYPILPVSHRRGFFVLLFSVTKLFLILNKVSPSTIWIPLITFVAFSDLYEILFHIGTVRCGHIQTLRDVSSLLL